MRVIADYDGTNGIFSATLDIAGKCSVKSILTDENGTVIAQSNEKESVNWTMKIASIGVPKYRISIRLQ